ncbi:hypothetical protein COZ61_00460 [Candidatus Berkelbacteria bacterium CG_4_8_14_3_um_filter_33_6]|nr:MAG: hypothetical protein COT76_00900 [Candidatus Berkelbacteria bacterium CG10_big_fil_rev_8_21_14_0_10_33_10]PIX31302.1 MAG: hypothetical protein COZ61_00460 [Candidatus Berkelbacteria bacterium CG_4_8_14_3_um_filter_33_6]PIZ28583.1 MAG: hypothetical protein COY43_00010 [Candidatus Berkelbacteria bacterium CG_4_10_14_0_8_um_filter_35_9_33_8]
MKFKPKTDRISKLATMCPNRIEELKNIFDQKSNIYIDYANVKPWSNKLGWHVDAKRLKQFLDSFSSINEVKLYNGTLESDNNSVNFNRNIKLLGYKLITKPVKVMRISIDVSSVSKNSPDILKNFIRKPLLSKLKIETVEFLNNELRELNNNKIKYLEDLKCNFDVEIGRDMLIDYANNNIKTFVLWSGDSDFADPIKQLLKDKKRVFLFATARRISFELNELQKNGLFIYDIQKIKDFICWKKELIIRKEDSK